MIPCTRHDARYKTDKYLIDAFLTMRNALRVYDTLSSLTCAIDFVGERSKLG